MPENNICPACASAGTADLFTAKDHLVSGGEFLIRRCTSCGMGWTVDPPSEEDAGRFYVSEEYISHTDRKQSLADYLYHLARRFMLGRKHRITTSSADRSSGTLLDIGSGTGYFAAFMQKKGWRVTGVELNDQARNFSASRFGINVASPGEVSGLASASADCITFWHVLEHLYDPAGWLAEVRRILRDNGKCIIALPNFASADEEWFGSQWAALDVPRHLWHFTPEAVRQFVGKQGFAVDWIEPLPLDLFYIASLSYRNEGKGLPLIRGAFTGVLIALRNLFHPERASSLVYVISKKDT